MAFSLPLPSSLLKLPNREFRSTRRRRLERRSLENEFSLTTFSFAATKNNSLPIQSFIVVIYLRILQWKLNFAQPRSLQNLDNAHFSLLVCRGRRRNRPDCILHVQFRCFVYQRYCLVASCIQFPLWFSLTPYSATGQCSAHVIFCWCAPLFTCPTNLCKRSSLFGVYWQHSKCLQHWSSLHWQILKVIIFCSNLSKKIAHSKRTKNHCLCCRETCRRE